RLRSAASEFRLSLLHRSLLYSIALELTQVAEVFWRNPVMCKFLIKARSEDPPPACAQELPAERQIKTATAAAATADADKASSIRHTFRLRLFLVIMLPLL